MKEKDKQFLYGKGHICQYCVHEESKYYNRQKCTPLVNTNNYVKIKQGITSFVIIVFDCNGFERELRTRGENEV